MSRFLQMHILTAYPPSNPNRDDLGRPKTAVIGGVQRMRISSQALKRAIRTSDAFGTVRERYFGQRTQRMGEIFREHLIDGGLSPAKALRIAREIAQVFGKLKKEGDSNPTYTEQLAFISPEERKQALQLADDVLTGGKLPEEKELVTRILRNTDSAIDIAMFGRMLADNPEFNRDAAVQIAHAFSTSRVDIEDDYYTAIDDLKTPAEDAGAGFIGEAGFGAGVFYLYVCVNRAQLLENLAGNEELADIGLSSLVRAVATASPSGKKNSFANHVRAEYILLERGNGQPRSLASAFIRPVASDDQLEESVRRLRTQRDGFERSYGKDWTTDIELRVGFDSGATLNQLAEFASQDMEGLAACANG